MAVEFTVAVPTHDRRETVVLAVRSVLAQTRPPAAVLVLCDGCTDGTAEAVRALGDPRVEALELAKGPGYAYDHRNRALGRARTEAITWLADDDLLLPDHFERIGELWDSGRYELVSCQSVLVHPDERLEWLGQDWSIPRQRELLAHELRTPMSAVSVSVRAARDAGGWDGAVPRAGDWDLWRRIVAGGARCSISPEPTHLHFRATDRVQPWEERVAQNRAWLERIGDPGELLELRVRLRRARSEEELRLREEHAQASAFATEMESLARESGAFATEMEAHARAAVERAEAAEGQARELAAALARIESGGWWRLRERLLPLLRAVGRSR